jgi:hypothetical protein
VSDQPFNKTSINEDAFYLSERVLVALSIPRIDPARFLDVIQAFGSLPDEGQVELANRLIEGRKQYLYHRISLSFDTTRPGSLRDRLKAIGSTAEKLLRLLHRDGAEPEQWNTHHVTAGALPELCRICS